MACMQLPTSWVASPPGRKRSHSQPQCLSSRIESGFISLRSCILWRIVMPEHVAIPILRRREVEARPGECLFADVRTPAEFGEVHMPGSINMPLADLGRFASELKARAAGKEVVLICRTGKRATAAFEQLLGEGFVDCLVL